MGVSGYVGVWGVSVGVGGCSWLEVCVCCLCLNCQRDIIDKLRVRAFTHKIFLVYHVYCNYTPGKRCRITVVFGTLQDGSLLIDIFASNICFSYRNIFQNGIDALSKIDDTFSTKS